MSSASVTSYSFVSSLPKDAAGVPFGGILRAEASVTPITMLKGIGTSAPFPAINPDLMFSHMAVGTHTATSKVRSLDPGVVLAGPYIESDSASALSPYADSGEAQLIRSTRFGELVVGGIAKTASLLTTSENSLASQVVYGLHIAGIGVTAGDTVTLEDFGNTKLTHVFSAANESVHMDFGPAGLKIGTSVVVVQSISGGNASATLFLHV